MDGLPESKRTVKSVRKKEVSVARGTLLAEHNESEHGRPHMISKETEGYLNVSLNQVLE